MVVALSEQERSELAYSLIPSLDAPEDESVEAAEEAVETITCYKNERSGLASIFQRRMHALSQTWVKACTRHSEIPFMDKRELLRAFHDEYPYLADIDTAPADRSPLCTCSLARLFGLK